MTNRWSRKLYEDLIKRNAKMVKDNRLLKNKVVLAKKKIERLKEKLKKKDDNWAG